MEKKRFFVGNLPHEIDEDVIRSRFSKYGEVLSVELKFCYSGLDQNEIISTFAFVNLQGSQESLSACLKKLPRKKWLGKEITVEFAKESILNELENERRAAKDNISGKTNDATKMPHSCFESNNGDLFENNEESVKIEDIKTSTLSKINFNSKSNSNILTKLENFSNVWKDCDEFSGRKITKFDDSSDFSTTVNERHENVFPKKNYWF
ncbi:uncharacterized protein LOC142321572 [Lycorma delicatula]|uniref:uncharacterized protein LOC142321572 n=1 Tax=Lycorma delicatula TaxID=130591 RepID=UPI003F5110FF